MGISTAMETLTTALINHGLSIEFIQDLEELKWTGRLRISTR